MRRAAAPTVFSERLAYARWVMQLAKGDPGSDRDFAEAADVGYGWLQKWKARTDAPQERSLVKKLCAYIGVSEDWLIDDIGDPPRPDLWAEWIAAYRWRQKHEQPKREPVRMSREKARITEPPPEPARKRAAGSGPRK
jgi:hypothetical protein